MKQFTAIALSVVLLFALCSCGNKNNQNTTSSNISNIKNSDTASNESNSTNTNTDTNSNNSSLNSSNSQNTVAKCTHVWGQWVEKKKATCEASGLKERSCHNCKKTETEKIKSLKHEESDWIIAKVAQIGKDGLKYTKCIHCDKQMNKETIPAITESHQHSGASENCTSLTSVFLPKSL